VLRTGLVDGHRGSEASADDSQVARHRGTWRGREGTAPKRVVRLELISSEGGVAKDERVLDVEEVTAVYTAARVVEGARDEHVVEHEVRAPRSTYTGVIEVDACAAAEVDALDAAATVVRTPRSGVELDAFPARETKIRAHVRAAVTYDPRIWLENEVVRFLVVPTGEQVDGPAIRRARRSH